MEQSGSPIPLQFWDVCSSALGKIREASPAHNCHQTRMHSTTRGVKQLTSSSSLKSGGQKDDEEVFSETCQNGGVSQKSGNSACHKVRSSRTSGNLPTLGLDDLTLWRNATVLTCFAEQIVEEWTRMKFGLGREKRGSGGGERQHATSQKSKKQLLRSWTFFPKNTCSSVFSPKKKSSEEQKKQLLIFFWMDRFWFR